MRVGIIGGGTIARLVLEHAGRGALRDASVVAILGRSTASRGKALAEAYGAAFVTTLEALIVQHPEVVVEAASHDAVRAHAATILERGIALIVLSGGAFCDDALREPFVLFEGSAREGVPHFPANVNIAAVLALSGIGFERTRLKVVADPALKYNTHFIEVRGASGHLSVKLENVPAPDNPKTAWLACYSALAALAAAKSPVRYGT